MSEATLAQLSEYLGLPLENGRPDQRVRRLAGLEDAGPGDLTFLANPKYAHLLATSKAEAAIVPMDVGDAPMPMFKTKNPDLAFAKAALLVHPAPPPPPPGVHPTAIVDPTATVGKDVSVGPHVVIEAGANIGDRTVIMASVYIGRDTAVGSDCLFYPGACIYHETRIGSRCIVHANAAIGTDGFGYAWTGKDYFKIPQIGIVVLEDDVEIGSCAVIDRARMGETRIGAGSKIDNLNNIAHNCKVGKCCAMAAGGALAGTVTIGNYVRMGGQVGVAGHLRVGDGVTVFAQSGISKPVPGMDSGADKESLTWLGSPAKPLKETVKEYQNVKALTRERKKIKELEARLKELERRTNGG